jgi:PAS domain S-box-containing protein
MNTFQNSLINNLTVQAEIIGSNSTAAITFKDKKTAEEILSALRSSPNIVVAVMYSKDGSIFARYQRYDVKGDFSAPGPQEDHHYLGYDHLDLFHTITFEGKKIGTLYIRSDVSELYLRLIWFAGAMFVIMVLSLILSLLLSSKLQEAVTTPVLDLLNIMNTISKGKDYSLRASVRSHDEIGTLTDGFNDMLSQIQSRDTELEQHRKTLEKMVAKRTDDLDRTNKQLQEELATRKKAEEALRASEERLRLALEATQQGWFDLNVQTGEVIVSPEYVKMIDYEPEEFSSSLQNWINGIHTEDRDAVLKVFRECLASGGTRTMEYRRRTKKGNWKWIRSIGKIVEFDSNNKPLRMSGTHTDITERKQAEEALKVSEEKYRLVVENANDAIMIVQDGMIKFPNRKSTVLSGYTKEELMSVTFSQFIHADDKDLGITMHGKRLQGQDVPETYSFRIINKSGGIVWVEASAVLVTWEGQPATLSFLRDITVQKKLEEQLLHAQKMEAIGTLAGGVAHDFNNLLMGILGYVSLMLMKTDKTHPFYEKLKTIEQLVESGAELTRQLLGFARGGKYEAKPINVNDLIIKTADIFGRTKKEIVIQKKLQEDLHATEADTGQIEQVLFNLYVNAWQAMPSGGRLYIETENVILDEQQCRSYDAEPGLYVKIAVTDTGVGMDSETQKRIFEPFFSTKGVGKGTGLGLASAYGIIKNHGGIINVYSEKGHGTTFNIYLPASEGKPLETKPTESSPLTGNETILIVDDEQAILLAVKELLEELGYNILTAQSGLKAIELYKKHSKDIKLVILDMIMPEMNGKETFVKLMEIDKNVCVLLSSGYSVNVEAKTILNLGCRGFIQKPFKVSELSEKIRTVMAGNNL